MNQSLSNSAAILATVILAACLVYDLRRGVYRVVLGRNVVLVSVFVWYLLEALQLPRDLGRFTQSEYDVGLYCVALAVAVFIGTYHVSRFRVFEPVARRLYLFDQPRVLWILLLAGMAIGIGGMVLYSGLNFGALFEGLTGLRARWTGSLQRGRYGSWSTILYELQMFLHAAVPLAVALLFMKRASAAKRCVAGTFVAWMSLRTFWSGTRGPLIPIILSISAAVFLNASPRMRRGLVVFGIPILMVAGYYWSAVVVVGRNAGQFNSSSATKVDYVGFEMFRELLNIRRATEKSVPLQWGLTYFTQLVNPIPRALWPGKPVADAGLIMASAYGAVNRSGEQTMTCSPGFLGEAYLNFGFLGLLAIPAAAGIIVRAWDDLVPLVSRSLPAFLVYAAGLATIIASGRSFNLSNYYGLLSLFVLMYTLEKMGIAHPSGSTIGESRIQERYRSLQFCPGKAPRI